MSFISIEFWLQFMSKSCSDLATINVEASFGNIFDFSLDLWIPFCKVVNSLSDLVERYIAFLPLWHLEHFQDSQNLSDFFVIFLNIIMGNAEILSNLFIHRVSDSVEFYRLSHNTSDISKFIGFLIRQIAAFDLSRNSMNTLDNIDHIFQSVFNIFLEILLVRIKTHVLFS